MSKHRLAVVTGVPAPYRDGLFSRLATHPDVDLQVFYCQKEHHDVAWSTASGADQRRRLYPHQFIPNRTPERWQRSPVIGYFNPGLMKALKDFDPTYLVVYGYTQATQWLALNYACQHGVRFALRGESNAALEQPTRWASRIRITLQRSLIRRADAILAIGSSNARVWQSYGAAPAQIILAPYAIDHEAIQAVPRVTRAPGAPARLLYAGRMIERKRPDLLVEAFEAICRETSAVLTMVGDGPLRRGLMERQSSVARARTRWLGRLEHQQVLRELRAADAFIFPSAYDRWAFVVNEALAAGLPVACHPETVGAAADLVVEGQTGWHLPEHSVAAMTATIRRVLADEHKWRRQAEAAQARVAAWSLDRAVAGFVTAMERRPEQRTAVDRDFRLDASLAGWSGQSAANERRLIGPADRHRISDSSVEATGQAAAWQAASEGVTA